MRGVNQLQGGIVLDAWQADLQRHADVEDFALRKQRDLAIDGDVVREFLSRIGECAGERADEAGGISRGEELLGIGAVEIAANHVGALEMDVKLAIAGNSSTVLATTGDMNLCRVDWC